MSRTRATGPDWWAMDTESALETISADGQRLTETAADVGAEVPTCPGWTVHDLLGHIGRIHRYVAEHVVRRATERLPYDVIEDVPRGEAVREYARTGLATVLDALSGLNPSEPMWTWSDRHEAGFFVRRMLHETAVHRFDAESSSGQTTGIDDDQGADGIDELYHDVMTFNLRRFPRPVPAGSLHLHRTDGPGEWMLRPAGDAIELSEGHEKGDAAVRGPGGELFLAMWGRIPLDSLEVFGDEEVARAWVELSP